LGLLAAQVPQVLLKNLEWQRGSPWLSLHALHPSLGTPVHPLPDVATLTANSSYWVASSNSLVRSEPFGSSSSITERCAARSRYDTARCRDAVSTNSIAPNVFHGLAFAIFAPRVSPIYPQ